MSRKKRSYTRARDPYVVRRQILMQLKEYGPTTYTHLMFAAELNSIHMLKYIADMEAARLIKVILIDDNNFSKYNQYVTGATRKLIVPTKRGLNMLEMIEEMPVIDYTNRRSLYRRSVTV